MTTGKVNLNSSTGIYKNGVLVGETDKPYTPQNGHFNFDDIVVKGDLSGELEYAGKTIVVEQVEMIAGMEVSSRGVRGPVWKKVRTKIVK